jgi:CRP-like cAMP-binding protein
MLQINDILKQVPFFQTLGKDSMDFIVDRLKFDKIEAGQDVVRIGDPGDTMYIVISGEVDVIIEGPDGKENKVAKIGSGNYFGEMALMTGEPRSATIRTNSTCELFSLTKDDFDIILEKFPSISLSLGKIMSQRLRQTLNKASQMSSGNAAQISGPKGNLSQKTIMDLFVFCEENSLTGDLIVINQDNIKATVKYKKGNMMRVEMEGRGDTDALDELLTWTDGRFEIKPTKLAFDGEEIGDDGPAEEDAEVEKNEIIVIHNSAVVQKIIQRTLTHKHWLINPVGNLTLGRDAINPHVFAVILDAKLPDGTAESFINTTTESHLYYIVLALGSHQEKYDAIAAGNDKVKVLGSNDVSKLVEMLESLQ